MSRIMRGWFVGGLLVAVIALSGNQLVWAALDWCCMPPSVTSPSPPANAKCESLDSTCISMDGSCSGEAPMVAGKGNCIAKESRRCENGVTTQVTVSVGHFTCVSSGESGCACVWVQNSPSETQQVSAETCSGEGC